MVWITGTATSPADLWAQLKNHLTTNPTLVAAGDQWQETWVDATSRRVALSGPGFGGAAPAHVLFRFDQPNGGGPGWNVSMADSIVTTAVSTTDHGNTSPISRVLLDENLVMPYWLSVNALRFVLVVKVSTIYTGMYAGCFLPYATPNEYPRPFFVGAATPASGGAADWTDTTDAHRLFHYNLRAGAASVRKPDGVWVGVASAALTGVEYATWPTVSGRGGSWGFMDHNDTVAGRAVMRYVCYRQAEAYGGGYVLCPFQLVSTLAGGVGGTLGQLDGVAAAGGETVTAEDVITDGAKSYIVFPNIFRQGPQELWALEMA